MSRNDLHVGRKNSHESDNTEVVSYWIPRIPIFCRMISFTKNVSYKLQFCPVLFLRRIYSWNTQQMKKTFFFVCLHYVMIDTGVKQIENQILYNLNKLNYYRCYNSQIKQAMIIYFALMQYDFERRNWMEIYSISV